MRPRTLHIVLFSALFFAHAGCASNIPEPETVTASELLERVQQTDANVVIVNFWATWCVPCREEFPEYVKFIEDYRTNGVALIFVSLDSEGDVASVSDFLEARGVDWKTYLKDGKTREFVKGISRSWSGALPATFIYDEEGRLEMFWEGRGTYARLERTVKPLLEDG